MAVNTKDIDVVLSETEANMVVISDKLFEDLGTNSKYTNDDRILAATYYAVTGSSLQAEKHMAAVGRICPAVTIRHWKNNSKWWKPVLAEVRKAKNEELDAKLTDVIMCGVEQLRDRMENGNVKFIPSTGEMVRVPLTSTELARDTIGIMYDKRALLRGDPTQRIEKTSTDETLRMLAESFIAMTTQKVVGGEKPLIEAQKVKTVYEVESEEPSEQ